MTPLPRPQLGAPAPDIVATDADGNPWRLGDHLGRHVVLVFHRHIH